MHILHLQVVSFIQFQLIGFRQNMKSWISLDISEQLDIIHSLKSLRRKDILLIFSKNDFEFSPSQRASTNWWWSTLFPPFTLAPSQPSTQAHPTLNPVSTRNPNSYTTAYPTNANCSQGWGYYAFTKKCYYFKQVS